MPLDDLELTLFLTRGTPLRDWHNTGMFGRELTLYRHLVERLRGVRMVSFGGPSERAFLPELGAIRLECNRWRLPDRLYFRYLKYWRARSWKRPQIIKTNQLPGAEIALPVARHLGAPCIVRCGYLYSDFHERHSGAESPQARMWVEREAALFPQADALVFTTPTMRDMVLARYAVRPERIHIIPNYVETDRFTPDPSTPPHSGHICTVAGLHPWKNLENLIRAVEGTSWTLDIAGIGPLQTHLSACAARCGGRVRLLGAVPNSQVPGLMRNAAVFVLPSLHEGHPKTLLEAMACGCAVVGTDVTGIRDCIRHRENGLLCGTDPDSLREAIASLMDDAVLRQQLGVAARGTILDEMSLERILDLECALYERLSGMASSSDF